MDKKTALLKGLVKEIQKAQDKEGCDQLIFDIVHLAYLYGQRDGLQWTIDQDRKTR